MNSAEASNRIARRLRHFREHRGLTQDEVAELLGFNDRQTLSDLEGGKRRITPDELVAATSALGVSIDDLTDPYRLVGEGGFSFRVEPGAEDCVAAFEERAGRLIAVFRELRARSGQPVRRLGHRLELSVQSSFEDAAAAAEYIWNEWDLGDVPAKRLEEALERHLDALVLYVDAPNGLSGAASMLPGLQTILINRNESKARRAFDLAHETFHILTWDAMPPAHIEAPETVRRKGNRVEQLANAFAAALLMPAQLVNEWWERHSNKELSKLVDTTARHFMVSPSALKFRLINLGLVSKRLLDQLVTLSSASSDERPRLFSARFVQLVATAVDGGQLSLRRAAGLLGLTVGGFVGLCREYGQSLAYEA
jgi:Zn-dependent peptidase ImmA (M78 family)/DNA-binding XRE family transcriptional regulator